MWQTTIVARIVTRPEKSAGGFSVRAALKQTDALHFPCYGRLRAESANLLSAARNPSDCAVESPTTSHAAHEFGCQSRAWPVRNPLEDELSAEIIQFVPRPNPSRDAIDRINGVQANIERQNALVGGNPNVPYGGQGIDGMPYVAPDKNPA